MKSDNELMLGVLWSLGVEGGGQDELRERPRLRTRGGAQVWKTPAGQRRRVRVRDIAADGVALLCPEPLTRGQDFVLELSRPICDLPVLCRVVHCRADGQQFRIGASFIKFLR